MEYELPWLPTVVQTLVDAYVRQRIDPVLHASTLYLEGRYDLITYEWTTILRRSPHLAALCAAQHHFPLLTLIEANHVAWANALLSNLTIPMGNAFRHRALQAAAARGHVSIVETLRSHSTSLKEDAQADENEALRQSASNGHVAVLQELRTHWGLGPNDARACDHQALRDAAAKGHVAVLEEFRMHWSLTAEDISVWDHAALRQAAANGHVAVMQELRLHWSLSDSNALSWATTVALHVAAGRDDVAVLQELRLHWGVTKLDVYDCNALIEAAVNGCCDAIQEFRLGWGVTKQHANKAIEQSCRFELNEAVLRELALFV